MAYNNEFQKFPMLYSEKAAILGQVVKLNNLIIPLLYIADMHSL